jgi:hypothetical protein
MIRSFRIVGGNVTDAMDRTTELQPGGGLTLGSISSFGIDGRGEIYIVDPGFGAQGEVYRVVPVLPALEVSGAGAAPFLPAAAADPWDWEDLQASSGHPIVQYRVYRTAPGEGPFVCVHEDGTPTWAGDPEIPPPGGVFGYVVTALDGAGGETSPGSGTGGTARPLSATPCPS